MPICTLFVGNKNWNSVQSKSAYNTNGNRVSQKDMEASLTGWLLIRKGYIRYIVYTFSLYSHKSSMTQLPHLGLRAIQV